MSTQMGQASASQSSVNQRSGTRILGYLWLQPGLSKMNGYTVLWAMLTGIPFLVVINFFQPYILTAILKIPAADQGSVSAWLAVLHEIFMIMFVGPFGALADRAGRRRILALGYIFVAAGLMIYPFAESVREMALYRLVYSLGAAMIVSTFSVLIADYPQEKSRGKFVAIAGVLNGLGILTLTAMSGILPKFFSELGYGPVTSGKFAMVVMGSICIVSGVVIALGLIGGDRVTAHHSKEPFLKLMARGIVSGKNPRIFASFMSAFAARGDVVVIGTYVSLWGTMVGVSAGLSEAEALAKATMVFAVIQTAALLAAPVIGVISDKIDRVTGLVVGMGLAAAGYFVFGFSTNPFEGMWYLPAAILGVGQMAAILGGTTLIGQEADPEITGATIGVWSIFGAVGTLAGSFFGGILYDAWRPGAPFLLMGFANFGVFLLALFVRIRWPQAGPLRFQQGNPGAES